MQSTKPKNRLVISFIFISGLLAGFFLGGFFWIGAQPRSYLTVTNCESCWQPNEMAGLLVSLGITKTPGLIPEVVRETEKSIAIKHPFPQARIHYVILPKVDIKDVSDITEEDQQYVLDSLNLIGEIVRENKLDNYQIITNGPKRQSVRYLHFHLIAK